MSIFFFFSSRRRHTRCALVTGVQTCTLPICNLVGALPVSLDILKANYWLVPFSADDPLHTPNTLNVALPTVALAFGDAIKTVMTSGYAFDEMLGDIQHPAFIDGRIPTRSEEHTSELQSLMRISYAVFCLKKKKQQPHTQT